MAYSPVALQVFAWLGLIFWSFQLAPQAWQNWKRKSTEGVSVAMLYLWYIGNLLYGAFAFADGLTIGLKIQPQIFALFTLINIIQIYNYGYKWPIWITSTCTAALIVGYAGLNVGLYYALKSAIESGNTKVETAMGILPAVFIALGFFPEFYVCIKKKSVEMANLFIALDISGGVFSTLSLAFDRTFNYVASIMYLVVVLLDFILLAMKIYYKWLQRKNKKLGNHHDDDEESGVDSGSVHDEDSEDASVSSFALKK